MKVLLYAVVNWETTAWFGVPTVQMIVGAFRSKLSELHCLSSGTAIWTSANHFILPEWTYYALLSRTSMTQAAQCYM